VNVPLRELSLFTGAGGGLLASKLLGWKTIGYVEINDYCQRVIAQRIKDGILDEAPIFGDIRAFISEGYAESYSGMVDVVTGGFPCQPFSIVGKKLGENDPQNMWPATLDCIRQVRPRYVFLENVPGLLTHPYFIRILENLSSCFLDAVGIPLSAAECGADHVREREWIFAYPDGESRTKAIEKVFAAGGKWETRSGSLRGIGREIPGPDRPIYPPRVVRDIYGIPNRVDRCKALGNAQIPIVAKTAWELLSGMSQKR
jgi:DNA (cytosine-5)-methyltransferase 1